jgi:anti-sigma factor RsiW
MLSDTELEILDAYLDDALSAEEAELLDSRLVVEPALAAALDDLRAQRAARRMVWRSMQPSQGSASQFVSATLRSFRRSDGARFGTQSLGRSTRFS